MRLFLQLLARLQRFINHHHHHHHFFIDIYRLLVNEIDLAPLEFQEHGPRTRRAFRKGARNSARFIQDEQLVEFDRAVTQEEQLPYLKEARNTARVLQEEQLPDFEGAENLTRFSHDDAFRVRREFRGDRKNPEISRDRVYDWVKAFQGSTSELNCSEIFTRFGKQLAKYGYRVDELYHVQSTPTLRQFKLIGGEYLMDFSN
jgi:hypothetical protein